MKCLSRPFLVAWLHSPPKPYFYSKTGFSMLKLIIAPSHCFPWLQRLYLILFFGLLGTNITPFFYKRIVIYYFLLFFLLTIRAVCNLILTFSLYLTSYGQVRTSGYTCAPSLPHFHKIKEPLLVIFHENISIGKLIPMKQHHLLYTHSGTLPAPGDSHWVQINCYLEWAEPFYLPLVTGTVA